MKARVSLKYFVNICRYLVLLCPEKHDAIYNRIKYLISLKSDTTYAFCHHYTKIKVNSYGSFPIEKRLTLQIVKMFIKSVLNNDKNHYYHDKFLGKCSYQLVKK